MRKELNEKRMRGWIHEMVANTKRRGRSSSSARVRGLQIGRMSEKWRERGRGGRRGRGESEMVSVIDGRGGGKVTRKRE